jgi:biotin operon repressor
MIQGESRANFALKALDGLAISGERLGQELKATRRPSLVSSD